MCPAQLFCNLRAARSAEARPIGALAIDAEEDFDWTGPISGSSYSTTCMHKLGDIQSIAEAWGARPTYLLTYPVLEDRTAVGALRRYFERGECALGIQLHTWVTPPLEGGGSLAASFAGNLPPQEEERKLLTLKALFIERFGFEPRVFRAGRYGLSRVTAKLLETHGFEVDTSVAPCTDYSREHGPDFSDFEFAPFWFGENRPLLEIPLCRSIVGWGGALGRAAYRSFAHPPMSPLRINSVLARSRAAERITLSPEGNDFATIRRLVRHLVRDGCRVLPLSFHSSSLAVGRNLYVRSKADLHRFYDCLSATLAFLAEDIGCRFASLQEIPEFMRPAAET